MALKRPMGGIKNGKVIDASADKKLDISLREAIAKMAGENEILYMINFKPARPVDIKPRGELLNGVNANNYYSSTGLVTIQKRSFTSNGKDHISPNKNYTYVIEFQDALDQYNTPDLKVIKFSIT